MTMKSGAELLNFFVLCSAVLDLGAFGEGLNKGKKLWFLMKR